MQETETTTLSAPTPRAGLSRFYTDLIGRRVFTFLLALHGVGAFALITFGVLLRKFSIARSVVRPLVAREISRAGVKLLPMFLFASLAMGFLIIGQAAPWVSRVGGENTFLGDIMVIVVVRELLQQFFDSVVLLETGDSAGASEKDFTHTAAGQHLEQAVIAK